MTSPKDRSRIKKIEIKVKDFTKSIEGGNIDTNLLKGIIGKKSVLVDCCELGKNRMTDFHKAANECRVLYKTSKFESIQSYLKNCKDSVEQISTGCAKISYIQNEIEESKKKVIANIFKSLSDRCNDLIKRGKSVQKESDNHSKVKISKQDPKAKYNTKEYYLLDFETFFHGSFDPWGSPLQNRVNEHNKDVEKIFKSLEDFDICFKAFSEKSALQVYNDKLKEAAKKDITNTLHLAKEAAPIFCGLGGLIVLTFGSIISIFGAIIRPAIVAHGGIESAVADLDSARQEIINLRGLLKDLESTVKTVAKEQCNVKHSADFLLKDQECLAKLGKNLVKCSSDMVSGLNSEQKDKSGGDSLIRDCRRKVALLISALGEELQWVRSN